MARSKNLKHKILALHKLGNLTQVQIAQQLGCTRSTVQYHTIPSAKEKIRLNAYKYNFKKKWHPYKVKLINFLNQKPKVKKKRKLTLHKYRDIIRTRITNFLHRKTSVKENITVDDVINKIGDNPICYLTGDPIDISQPKTYNFDHIIPVARGGASTLDNLDVCTKQANFAKGSNTNEEFIELCKKVLIHQGYEVIKK